MRWTDGMWEHQKQAYEFGIARNSVMLAMDMGTGKTKVAVSLLYGWGVKTALVVCPKSVIGVWGREFRKHAPDGTYDVHCLSEGKVVERANAIRNVLRFGDPNLLRVVVINYDVIWQPSISNAIRETGVDCVILDESHRAKAAGSKTSKTCFMLGKRATYRICMSGTPMSNSPLDLYGQYRFLDPLIFGTNYARFLDQYAVLGGPEKRFVVGYKNLDDLSTKFRSIAFQCRKEDLPELGLPGQPVSTSVTYRMAGRAKRLYEEVYEDLVSEIDGGHVVAGSVITALIRLQQITSGYCMVTDDDGSERLLPLNNEKQDILTDILKDVPRKDNVVVFCRFKPDISAAKMAAADAGFRVAELSGSRNELDLWMKHEGSVLVVQIAAGNAGIDLSRASIAIYYSLTFSLSDYEQSISRLYRPGQKNQVSLIHILAENTVDEKILDALVHKRSIVDDVLTRGVEAV